MKFFGRRSVFTRFTNVANSENAFSCGFLRMERFNLALPDVIMVATWMLCREWMEFVGTLSWLPHGCSVGVDSMVATWMLCGNGWSLFWTL